MLFRAILTSIAVAASGLVTPFAMPVALAQASNASTAAGDSVILEMNQAYKRGDKKRLSALLPQARGHALEPWAAYWELRARLDEAPMAEVQDFFTRYAGSYQEDRLRNDLLLLMGQRRDWTNFAALHPSFRMGDDREVRCYALLIEHIGKVSDVTAEVRRLWLSIREADDGCTTAADRLISEKKMQPEDAWRKARLAMENNRPRVARKAVEMVAPEVSNQIDEINSNAARYLTSRVTAAARVRKELVLLALIKMAASDPGAAALQLENKWGPQLTAEERNWGWGTIGKQAANRLSPDALAHFAKVSKDADLTDDMLGWKVRAALRAGSTPRWPLVKEAIQAMSAEARQDSTWIYWNARALLATAKNEADKAEATKMLEGIAGMRGFYEQLAQEDLGRRITLPAKPAVLTADEMAAARQNLGLNRGLYAILIGLRSEGVREWNYATNLHTPGGMNDRELLAAADFACQREVWDRCINTSERTRGVIDVEQRFPMPFHDAVLKRTAEIGLDPAYVYGLIRQESRFIMDARSGVGASGLMQVMPATARWTAKKIGLNNFTQDQITDRDTNIAIGTGYLKLVLDDFQGSMPLAAAAYNAGPGRPRNWRNGPMLEAAIWAENVPFSETRDYVKKVLSNTVVYSALITRQPQSLKGRLGTIGPREGAAPENKDLP
ncbi:transglycosylase SLT domain-containing protein [Variovorax sp. VNK109]|uniref:lytic transglycosylase domain-containing protein n=1 Tax=Variovorax sp. VNK109 TaxID=3400919 RepID=UPI003C03378C